MKFWKLTVDTEAGRLSGMSRRRGVRSDFSPCSLSLELFLKELRLGVDSGMLPCPFCLAHSRGIRRKRSLLGDISVISGFCGASFSDCPFLEERRRLGTYWRLTQLKAYLRRLTRTYWRLTYAGLLELTFWRDAGDDWLHARSRRRRLGTSTEAFRVCLRIIVIV